MPSLATPRLPLAATLRGHFLRRYKRFFVDIETESGEELTVYCPDPGRMRSSANPGAALRCSTSTNPKRKLRHTLEMIRERRTWVGVNPQRANSFVDAVLAAGAFAPLEPYTHRSREVSVDGGSRLDFLLTQHPDDPRPAFLEVKSATSAEAKAGHLVARFPDAVTARGTRHLEALAALAEQGARAILLFLVQRSDCQLVEPAEEIDPVYARTLRDAHRRGVEIFALQARVQPDGISLIGTLPVRL